MTFHDDRRDRTESTFSVERFREAMGPGYQVATFRDQALIARRSADPIPVRPVDRPGTDRPGPRRPRFRNWRLRLPTPNPALPSLLRALGPGPEPQTGRC